MSYTPEQIRSAARLVPKWTDSVWSKRSGIPQVAGANWRGGYVMRDWQPWADTKSGRSDALVLLAAVCKWTEENGAWWKKVVTVEQANKCRTTYDALASGNVESIQAAVMAAAVAIGESMGGGE